MLNKDEALALCRAEHGDPFAVLGLHEDAAGRLWLRALQPGADAVFAIDADTGRILAELEQREVEPFGKFSGLFEAQIPAQPPIQSSAQASAPASAQAPAACPGISASACKP